MSPMIQLRPHPTRSGTYTMRFFMNGFVFSPVAAYFNNVKEAVYYVLCNGLRRSSLEFHGQKITYDIQLIPFVRHDLFDIP